MIGSRASITRGQAFSPARRRVRAPSPLNGEKVGMRGEANPADIIFLNFDNDEHGLLPVPDVRARPFAAIRVIGAA